MLRLFSFSHRRGKKVANMVSGNGMTHLYFKNGGGWAGPTPREEIETIDSCLLDDLVQELGVDIVAVRRLDGAIDVLSKKGEATLRLEEERVGSRLRYKIKNKYPFAIRNPRTQGLPRLSPQRTHDGSRYHKRSVV